jgi:hypothetical protein
MKMKVFIRNKNVVFSKERRNAGRASFQNRSIERKKKDIDEDDDDDDDDNKDEEKEKDEVDPTEENVSNIRERRFRDFASIEYNEEIYMVN